LSGRGAECALGVAVAGDGILLVVVLDWQQGVLAVED